MADNVTPISSSGEDGGSAAFNANLKASDAVLAARAILQCYIDTLEDEHGDDRYVLWAVREKLDEAVTILD